MPDAVIVGAVRTPVGKYGGVLKDVRPDDLGALVIRELVARTKVPPADIEDVILGCANQAGEDNRNVARMCILLAGLPVEVAGLTVNRLCGSGLDAVIRAAQAIQTGNGDCFIAGGTESMTRAPWAMPKAETPFPRGQVPVYDTALGWRFTNPALAAQYYPYSMGETAENVAERWKIAREAQDEYALESHRRAVAAQDAGRFADEIVPVEVKDARGEKTTVTADEGPRRDTSLEKLAKLKPVFRESGSVTAGNSAGLNDGAAALLLMSAEKAKALGMQPLARVVASAVAGVDPACMGIGPVPATRKALRRAGLKIEDMDLIELNEAFAVQVLACVQELDLDRARLNVSGGAIALGHPLGSTGARLTTTLLHELRRRQGRYGLVTMCIGVGQGIAAVFENLAGP